MRSLAQHLYGTLSLVLSGGRLGQVLWRVHGGADDAVMLGLASLPNMGA